MTHEEQVSLVEAKLPGSPDAWRVKVFRLSPRNTAWLRGQIYGIVGHDAEISIHRIAPQGDAESTKDHEHTQKVNREKRTAEGSYPHPTWYRP